MPASTRCEVPLLNLPLTTLRSAGFLA